MTVLATAKLEFSVDPLSDTTPTWTDITRYCLDASWQSGVGREFDDPQAGSATFVLKNLERRFEPDYAGGAYYPNIVPGRRFRWSVIADGVTYQQGIWYATSWQVEYPIGTAYSTVTVACADGFWRLALDRLTGLPGDASTYQEVVTRDNPWGYWPLDEESGAAMNALTGPSGAYRGNIQHVKPNPVLGDDGYAVYSNAISTYGRAKVDDDSIWVDSGQVSCEGVVYRPSGTGNGAIVFGPFRTPTTADYIFTLSTARATVYPTASVQVDSGVFVLGAGWHHVAMTWDGLTLCFYQDGVLVSAVLGVGNAPVAPDASDWIRVAGDTGTGAALNGWALSHAAVYNYALTPAQVASHSTAATGRGYDAETSGSRIAALATDPLWSTAGIPAGTITAAARFQAGQTTLDEIIETTRIEQPGSLFYFDDAGNPDYRALQDSQTVSATFGESEVQYDSIQLVYNDELFNTSTVSGEGLAGSTAQNTQSLSDYGVRAQDATSLIITTDQDAALISQAIVDRFGTPQFRVDSITLNGSTPAGRLQILSREVGDTIRVKRRTAGTPIDIITRILSKDKSLTVDGDLRCTWTLARGFNASAQVNHLGVTGFCELGSTFILA